MAENEITIPGTDTKIPVWFVVLIGALVLVIVAMKGSPKKEEEGTGEDIPQYGVDILAAELNQRLREQYNDFWAGLQYYLDQEQGNVTPPSAPIIPPGGGPNRPGYPGQPGQPWPPMPAPIHPPIDYPGEPWPPMPAPIHPPPASAGFINPLPRVMSTDIGLGGSDPFLSALDLAEVFSPVTVARSLYQTYTDRKPGGGDPYQKPMYDIGDTFIPTGKGGSPDSKRVILRPRDNI